MTSTLFGPFAGPNEVREALSATLELWMPTYVAAFNRDAGARKLTAPLDYRFRPKYRTVGAQRPDTVAMVPVVTGTSATERQGDGSVRVTFAARVESYCYGTDDWATTMGVAYDFGLLVGVVCSQKPSLGGVAESTRLERIDYGDEDMDGRRMAGVAVTQLSVVVGRSFSALGGPSVPTVAQPPEPPGVQSTDVTVSAGAG